MTIGPDMLSAGHDMAGQILVSPTGKLSNLRVSGGTPGTIVAGHVGLVRVYGGYGPVVSQINENGIQRRVEAAVPGNPYPLPAAPPATAPSPSPAGVTFQYVYESGSLTNPQLTVRVTNTSGAQPDQYDLSLVVYNDTAKFNLARLDASGVSGIRDVAVEGDVLTSVTSSASPFFKLSSTTSAVDNTAAGIRLPSDTLAGVGVRDYVPNGGYIQAKSIQAVAFGSYTRSNGPIGTGAVALGADAAKLLAVGTKIVPANDTYRVPFADLASQQVGLFLDTDPLGGHFDDKNVALVVQGVSTPNGNGTSNIVQPSNTSRGAVIALVKAVQPVDSKGRALTSVIQTIDLRGDGGSIRTQQAIAQSITSTGPLGDLLLQGPLTANVTAPSLFGSIDANGGAISSTIQTTGIRLDPITGATISVPADLGRVYVATGPKAPSSRRPSYTLTVPG